MDYIKHFEYKLIKGESKAWGEVLTNLERQRIYYTDPLIYSADHDDFCNICYLKILKHLGKDKFQSIEKLFSYLGTIYYHLFIALIEKRKNEGKGSEEGDDPISSPESNKIDEYNALIKCLKNCEKDENVREAFIEYRYYQSEKKPNEPKQITYEVLISKFNLNIKPNALTQRFNRDIDNCLIKCMNIKGYNYENNGR